ncbi:MAG: DUF3466 family protein [Oligoflexia bacterium]|nr:DUF3466 family protein [Oligoflexia bacterium]
MNLFRPESSKFIRFVIFYQALICIQLLFTYSAYADPPKAVIVAEIIDPNLDPSKYYSLGRAVNEFDEVAGVHQGPLNRAFIWLPQPKYGLPAGVYTLPPTSNGKYMHWSNGINNLGVVVGAGYGLEAMIWTPTPMYGFPAGLNSLVTKIHQGACPYGGCWIAQSEALAINDSGKVVGWYSDGYNPSSKIGFSWSPTEGFVKFGSELRRVNAKGEAAGFTQSTYGIPTLCLPVSAYGLPSGCQNLPTIPYGQLVDLDNLGNLLGNLTILPYSYAFLRNGFAIFDVAGGVSAAGMNDHGDAVGDLAPSELSVGPYQSWAYLNGSGFHLIDSLLPSDVSAGHHTSMVQDINENRTIVGTRCANPPNSPSGGCAIPRAVLIHIVE